MVLNNAVVLEKMLIAFRRYPRPDELAMVKAKKAKGRDIASIPNGGDRLSDLPDSILHHVFSFIDARFAVQASLLSSRWEHLWKSLPNLNIDWNTKPLEKKKKKKKITPTQRNQFAAELATRVLVHSDRNCDIQSLRLQSIPNSHSHHISSWILTAIGGNVQVLDIESFRPSCRMKLSVGMFSSRFLTTLRLSTLYICRSRLPAPKGLSNLKVLHLKSVDVEDVKTISEFISSNIALKHLVLHCVDIWSAEGDIVINAPKLESLVLNFVHSKRLNYEKSMTEKYRIEVCAPNLRIFGCDSYCSREYSLGELCFLDSASLYMTIADSYKYKPFKDLGHLPEDEKREHVKRITGLLEAVRGVIFESTVVSGSLSLQFHNLKYLKLETWLSRDCVLVIRRLMSASPQLETVSVEITEKMLASANMEECSELGLSEECLFHLLKVLEISGVIGCVNEFKLLQLVLRKAIVLEKMCIQTYKGAMESKREKELKCFRKMLLMTPRASSNVAALNCIALNPLFAMKRDRLSDLPDSIIHHIFSFIDTRYAV
ncbi:hypothetical protein Sjap_003600 [Stephania japonica]|uniref:F-box domain-containing protein n=1 Tax=Stephania japonica TaxID=461633 RepID=A0AAP0KRQ4_9MAGN